MPPRLKQLDLQGYKTFATRTQFIFGDGITAVVGPNGSGKSNIADSIRWVLGEQSFSVLRGKKTEDMIFAGSELRPRAGMAQAMLTFDNADGWLPIDFNEVSIARRAYRDGENEYLLNGQRVRLRDVAELLSRCGLAERTYTIIGQGLVDAALSLKAEERRALFEEAAEIGAYRDKREDALKRLEQTARNLERAQDILAEIRPRLRGLERQAARARDFTQVRKDLDELLKVWYGFHWHDAQRTLAAATEAAALEAGHLAALQNRQESLDTSVTEMRARMAGLRAQLNARRGELSRLRTERETLAREQAVAAERIRLLEAQRAELAAELAPLESALAEATARAQAAEEALERVQREADDARREAHVAEAESATAEADRAHVAAREAAARAARQSLADRTAELNLRLEQSTRDREQLALARAQSVAAAEQSEARAAVLRAELVERERRLAQARSERETAEAELQRLTGDLTANEARLAELTARANELRGEETALAARLEALEQVIAGQNDFASGARALLAAARAGRWSGNLGGTLDQIQVAAEYDAAIGAALGVLVDSILVEDFGAAEGALALLEAEGGRAVLLPLSRLQPQPPPAASGDPGVLGVASELVECAPELRRGVDALLGHVLVVRSRQAAYRLMETLPGGALVVTLAGEAFTPAGPIVGGRISGPTAISRAREAHDLSGQLATTRQARAQAEAERQAVEIEGRALREARAAASERQAHAHTAERESLAQRDEATLAYEGAAREAGWRREQADLLAAENADAERESDARTAELDALLQALAEADTELESAVRAREERAAADRRLSDRLASIQTSLAVAERAAVDAEARAREAEQARSGAESLVNTRQWRLAALEADAANLSGGAARQRERAAALDDELGAVAAVVEPAEAELARLEADQAQVEGGEGEARATLHAAERQHAEAQLELARRREEVEALRRRIEEDFGLVDLNYSDEVTGPTPLPLGDLVARLLEVDSLPDGLEESIQRRRAQIRRMGAINPEAPTEFEEVKERHDFLTTQLADLEAAGAQLREVVAEMDLLMEREFRKTFDAVAAEFRETFTRLFGGGTARLTLTDPDQLTTSGIDIVARLPGRRQQGLALLSGGERSLTACALVFALLRVSPTPFCVLDEVDAMLDEANVGRFRDLLAELATRTQFIVITHNRATVQAADTVYGVSMGADSASQVVSLKLEGEKIAA